ncbi:hypothetical protein LCGC14_2582630 [marine sediment metagenome]|uniref:Uncharacterized protein n=1 Tax=marine sediment metagenome TaxID=412755 RepID=A0A0F9B1Z5_9ZZZZ
MMKPKYKVGDEVWIIAHQPLRLPIKIRLLGGRPPGLIRFAYLDHHPHRITGHIRPEKIFKTKADAYAALKLQWTRDYKELKEREQI